MIALVILLATLGIGAVTLLGYALMRAAAGDEMIARLNHTEGDG